MSIQYRLWKRVATQATSIAASKQKLTSTVPVKGIAAPTRA